MRSTGGLWGAVCEPLKLTVSADTWNQLMEDIGTTIDLVFADLLEAGKLDECLARHGWMRISPEEATTEEVQENVKFDIPFIPAVVAQDEAFAKSLSP